jgi:hypothetical protein
MSRRHKMIKTLNFNAVDISFRNAIVMRSQCRCNAVAWVFTVSGSAGKVVYPFAGGSGLRLSTIPESAGKVVYPFEGGSGLID